ncbi:MAG: hypothetical protein H0V29_07155 [Thermoleophilaceae bacterium]|nr:hypothetical protein [Thermoleophilaceae bacterium]
MTGVGYLARGGTAARPSRSDGEQARAGGKRDEEAQVRPYQAAFDVWGNVANKEGWFQGIYRWQWEPARHRNPEKKVSEEGGFSPQGRLAELELCRRQGAGSCRITRVPR